MEVLAEPLAELLPEVLIELLAALLTEVLTELLAELLMEVLAELLAEPLTEVLDPGDPARLHRTCERRASVRLASVQLLLSWMSPLCVCRR